MSTESATDTVLTPFRSNHAESQALRLLSGAGHCQITAFGPHSSAHCEVAAHTLSTQGELCLVLLHEKDPLPPGHYQVRLSIMRESLAVKQRIITASMHGLGTLRVTTTPPDTVPDGLKVALSMDHGVYATFEPSRMLLHDAKGVSVCPAGLLEQGKNVSVRFPAVSDEFDSYHVWARSTQSELAWIVTQVEKRNTPGWITTVSTASSDANTTTTQFTVLDVDAWGVLLLEESAQGVRTIFAEFSAPVRSLTELTAAHRAIIPQDLACSR